MRAVLVVLTWLLIFGVLALGMLGGLLSIDIAH